MGDGLHARHAREWTGDPRIYGRRCLHARVCGARCGTAVSRDGCRIAVDRGGDARGGLPAVVQCDNGTEFTSTALDHWAYWNHVQLDYSRPGKPVDNCVCEAFNGSLRQECLSQHWFATLAEAQTVLEAWRQEYNHHRPHTTLGLQPPAVYRPAGIFEPRSVRAIN